MHILFLLTSISRLERRSSLEISKGKLWHCLASFVLAAGGCMHVGLSLSGQPSTVLLPCRYVWLPMWAMQLSPAEQVQAANRISGSSSGMSSTARTAQLPARIPVAGVDVVVRWKPHWTLKDLGDAAISRFVMV